MNISPISSPTKRFLAVSVPDSPLNKQGNLTGNPRHIRDNVAQLYNFIQEWNALFSLGINELTGIVDFKTQYLNNTEVDLQDRIYPNGLQKMCNNLQETFEKMVSAKNGMEKILSQFRSLKKLEDMKETKSKVIFLTWTLQKFVDTVSDITMAYKKEAEVNCIVVENIAHASTLEKLTLFFALWVHQPYIEDNIEFQLEAMLKETGHR